MVETKERLNTEVNASRITAQPDAIKRQTRPGRRHVSRWPLARSESQIDTVITPRVARLSQIGHFVKHYFEMCLPVCIGFAVGDLVYFWSAGLFGYSEPFRELPELSVVVVALAMTAPMAAWMLFRGMARRPTAEMSAAMPILAIVLLAFGRLAIVPNGDLALLEHGLMMPVMLVPMLFRLDVYTGRTSHAEHIAGAPTTLAGDR